MTTLLNRIDTTRAFDPVVLQPLNHINNLELNKPQFAVVDVSKNKIIALHGDKYLLLPYRAILEGLSRSLEKYGMSLDNAEVKFTLANDLSRFKLQIFFNDLIYTMQSRKNDNLKFGIEIVSSYDASLIFQLRFMFYRLICKNGLKSWSTDKAVLNKHTTNFNLEHAFNTLNHFKPSYIDMQKKLEVFDSIKLNESDVDSLFNAVPNINDSKKYLLNSVLEVKKNQASLFDVYNAVTNYSTHNQRALKVGKRSDNNSFEIRKNTQNELLSNETRELEVKKFLASKTFLSYLNNTAH